MKVSKTTIIVISIAAVTILAVWKISSGRRASTPTAETAVPSPPSSASGDQTQTNEGGNVTVSVTPHELATGKPITFQVIFDTHSVNLDFDVAAVARLYDEQGNTYGTAVWTGDPPGGHHRKGALTFSVPIKQAMNVSLTLKDIAGVSERIFTWKL